LNRGDPHHDPRAPLPTFVICFFSSAPPPRLYTIARLPKLKVLDFKKVKQKVGRANNGGPGV
jgi:hypothetical protein